MKIQYVALSVAVAACLATAPVHAGLLGGVSGAGSFGGTAAGGFGRHAGQSATAGGSLSDGVEVAKPHAPRLGLEKKANRATSATVGATGSAANSASATAGRSTELTGTLAGQAGTAVEPHHVTAMGTGSGGVDLARNAPSPDSAPAATSAKPQGTTPNGKPGTATKPARTSAGSAGSTTASESTSPPPSVGASGSASANGSVNANR